MRFEYEPIGIIHTPFTEKFGVPRQSMLIESAWGLITLMPHHQFASAIKDLETFSHVWLLFPFHKNADTPWHPLIETPRETVRRKLGVFATRSPHRPNAIGMSAVRLCSIDASAAAGIEIHVEGVDLLDGTPIFDIKPYLPYADAIADANHGWISEPIKRYEVRFSDESIAVIEAAEKKMKRGKLLKFIEQMAELDPRPTSQRRDCAKGKDEIFAFRVLGLDIHWRFCQNVIEVYEVIGTDLK